MILIIGGAYQGKLEYVKERFAIKEEDIFSCQKSEIEFGKKVIYSLENFVLDCVKNGLEAKDYLEKNKNKLEDKIIICEDISCGVVPIEKEMRLFREMVGRTLVYLGKESDEVIRLFCGLPQRIK